MYTSNKQLFRMKKLRRALAFFARICYTIIVSAGMMELADVTDSKSVGSDTVPVRPRLPAPFWKGSQARLAGLWAFSVVKSGACETVCRQGLSSTANREGPHITFGGPAANLAAGPPFVLYSHRFEGLRKVNKITQSYQIHKKLVFLIIKNRLYNEHKQKEWLWKKETV